MAKEPVDGIQVLSMPRPANRAPRVVQLEVRFEEVPLKPPRRRHQLGEIKIWAILAEEIDAQRSTPPGEPATRRQVEPLQWMLLTTVALKSFDDATEKLLWYTRRWGIEVYHRTLKSGCKIEQRRLDNADRLEAYLAIDMVVAWHMLGRETPEVPRTVFFEHSRWKALYSFVHQQPMPP